MTMHSPWPGRPAVIPDSGTGTAGLVVAAPARRYRRNDRGVMVDRPVRTGTALTLHARPATLVPATTTGDRRMSRVESAMSRLLGRRGAQRSNVLWMCADDYAPYVSGAYGNPLARTPNLDRLA